MGERGVTRPMEALSGHAGGGSEAEGHTKRSGDASSHHEMSREDRLEMVALHHQQTLWIYWTLPLLGLWMLCAPLSLGYLNEALWVSPSGGRGVWFSEQTHDVLRAWLMTGSDTISGLLLLVVGWRTLKPNRPVSLWTCGFVGIWLTLAPVLLWAPTAAAYLNNTVVGMLLIALTILIPGMPNMMMYMQHGPPTPPGWSYNPSSWAQRWIMIVTGLLGFVVSRYLAMFQLGYITYVWDPFFGFHEGTERVLNSKMSHMWPISDAGLGAISYTFEFLMGYMGSPARWRTMPWMVAFFGVLVIPLGLTHIFLVISQPVVVHAWCTMCLLAAAIMLPMIPLEVDEVVAMFQHLRQAKNRGDRGGSLWELFWKGGTADGCTSDERSPELVEFADRPGRVFRASLWGMSFPWTLIAATLTGVLLMFCPTWFGIDIATRAADVAHLGGALIMTISVVSMGEVIRTARWLNALPAICVIAGAWLTTGTDAGYAVAGTILGGLALVFSIPRGPKTQSYGEWDVYIR